MMSSSKKAEMLKDEVHNHRVELVRLDKKAVVRSCVACTQGIIDNCYYICPHLECNYFLHKFCGELPLEIKHGFHQTHSLKLKTHSTSKCDACMENSEGYFYTCVLCSFNLDLICATLAKRELEHPGHPHPLTLLRTQILAYCYCCGKKHQGIFYQCLKCVFFWIHKDCASFGTHVEAPNHPHPLHFVYSSKSFQTLACNLCHNKVVYQNSWYLQCVPCEFLCHVHCAMFEGKNKDVEEIDSEIPRLPWEECDGEFGIVGLLNRKIETNDEKVEENQEKITHFSHPEHELVLQEEVPKVEDPYHGHQIPLSTKCNGCTRKISSPFYCCLHCDFFLHKCCAFLPNSTRQHPLYEVHDREYNLVQTRKPWRVEEVFRCDFCLEYCNGFCFECEEESCSYKVDVECAFLPTSIVHKSHPFHRLTLTDDYSTRMRGCCRVDKIWSTVYECPKCNFWIHTECAMYPGNASHRYDHENPFKLWYDRGAVEANYFYCERCEESMDPKQWYYHSKSSIGDQLMHPNCILQQERPNLMKFKSTRNFLLVDIHPHRLHLSLSQPADDSSDDWMNLSPSQPSDDSSNLCGYCENVFKELEDGDENDEDLILSYDCWEVDCVFRLHHSCAMKLRGRDSTGAEEYPE